MKTLYLEVAKQLSEKCPFLRMIDLDLGQMETPFGATSRPMVAYPCALITIDIPRVEDITILTQRCVATITIRYNTDRTQDTALHVSEARRSQGLEPYDHITEIYKALQGFWTPHFSPLHRTRQGREHSAPKGIFRYTIQFETEFEDFLAEED